MQDANDLIHSCPSETYGTFKNKYAVANDSDLLDLQSYNTMDLMIMFYRICKSVSNQYFTMNRFPKSILVKNISPKESFMHG